MRGAAYRRAVALLALALLGCPGRAPGGEDGSRPFSLPAREAVRLEVSPPAVPDGGWPSPDRRPGDGRADALPHRHVLWLVLGVLGGVALCGAGLLWLHRAVRQRTAELRAGEKRWRSYIDAAPFAAVLMDGSARLVEVNPEACRITGYERAELMALTLGDLFAPEGRAAGLADFARLSRGERFATEHPIRTLGGATRWIALSAIRLGPDRFLGYFTDITERRRVEEDMRAAQTEQQRLLKEAAQSRRALLSVVEDQKAAQEALRSLSARQEALLSAIPDIIMEVNVQKVYTWANAAGLRFFGPDVLGREACEYFEGAQDIYDRVQPLFDGAGEVMYVESWQRRMDGQVRLLAWWCRVLKDEQDRVIGAISTARDITEQRELEEQFRQAQKIDAVGRLAGGVAHDFNNMLGVILGHAEMALEQMAPSDPLFDNLQEICKAAQRSADLTRQLLAFARKQTIQPQLLNLNAIVSNMLKMLRRLIGEDIELAWSPGPDLWLVRMDPVQVDQIMANLAVNARDAMPGVGRLTIRTENFSLAGNPSAEHPNVAPGEYVRLSVGDTGVGMDESVRVHLFEPFFTTKATGQGTGLGLATIYGAVKQNQGHIEVDSEPGRGTTFHIYIPRALPGALAGSKDRAAPLPTGHETILLVEDAEPLVKLVANLLEKNGYRVLKANRPSAALALAGQQGGPIHLVITDVIMPDMNGRELVEQVRRLHPDIRVLFMSGYPADVIARQGILEDGTAFIQKPAHSQVLLAKMREILDRP